MKKNYEVGMASGVTIDFKTFKRRFRFIRSIFKFVGNLNVWFVQILYFFSSKWCLQSSLLNKLGSQTFRIKLADKALLKRRSIQSSKQQKAGVPVQSKITNALSELDEKGLIKVKSVLPEEFFSAANLAEQMKSNDRL